MDTIFNFQNMTHTLQIAGSHFGVKPALWVYPKHHHHLYELLHCIEGEAKLTVNGQTVRLQRGDWMLLKPGVSHTVENPGEAHFCFFNTHFDLDDQEVRIRLGASPYRLISAHLADASKLPPLVSELERMLAQKLLLQSEEQRPGVVDMPLTFVQRLALQANLLEVIEQILLLLEHDPAEEPRKDQVSAYEADVANAVEERLTAALSDRVSVSAIAADLGMSRSQICRIFAKVYGQSPRQYVSKIKLSKAKELLVTTNLTVYAMAERLGFRSVHHFSRQFRRWTGMSPSRFRHSRSRE